MNETVSQCKQVSLDRQHRHALLGRHMLLEPTLVSSPSSSIIAAVMVSAAA